MEDERFEIELVKLQECDSVLARTMKHCWGVDSKMDKKRLFACNDSILEIPEYYAFCKAPRSVAMQLRTHEKRNGMYFWCGTARPDRKDAIEGEYSRDQIVPFVLKLTARAVKEIAHQRLCFKAEKATRDFVEYLRKKFILAEPWLAEQMVTLCQYRNGICTEFNSCGFSKKLFTNKQC